MLTGIYAADLQVFRFYPDGLVLDVLVRPAPSQDDGPLIATWLRRDEPPQGVYTARYTESDGVYTFETRSHLRDEPVHITAKKTKNHLTVDRRDGGRTTEGIRFIRIYPDRSTT